LRASSSLCPARLSCSCSSTADTASCARREHAASRTADPERSHPCCPCSRRRP
jgi:hypothetical protein